MATGFADLPSPVRQLRFDITEALQPVARRAGIERLRAKPHGVASIEQLEMRIPPIAGAAAIAPAALPDVAPGDLPVEASPAPVEAQHREEAERPDAAASAIERPPFATWLLDQVKQSGMIGELARAARGDPGFPRRGGVGDIRKRFNALGADGDAFEALDDAERAYDRV